MNHSFYSVDRAMHLKIVAIALVAATAVAGISIAAHSSNGLAQAEQVRIVKAGQPAAVASNPQFTLR
jgi:hypothetical protein